VIIADFGHAGTVDSIVYDDAAWPGTGDVTLHQTGADTEIRIDDVTMALVRNVAPGDLAGAITAGTAPTWE